MVMKEAKEKIYLEAKEYSKLLEFVTSKQFALARLGITDKMSYDWRNSGVYLQEKKTKFRMKYSPIEYIWLLLVKELRDFGLPMKSVIDIKDFLVAEVDIEKLLIAIHDEKVDSDTVIVQELSDEIQQIAETKTALKKEIVNLDKHIVDSMLTSMVVSTLLKEQEYVLYIKKDGACLIETIEEDRMPDNTFLSDSSLRIPFNRIVQLFLSKENVTIQDKQSKETITQTFDFKFLKEESKNKKTK